MSFPRRNVEFFVAFWKAMVLSAQLSAVRGRTARRLY
jgi:hypothetical protein